MAAVEARIPSVVLSAKDGDGSELLEVNVTMDGTPIATRLDGHAVEVNPGLHTFVFQGLDGKRGEAKIAVREGVKAQAVSVVFPRSKPDRTMSILGFTAGGLGIVGLGVGAVFGIQAISKTSESKGDPLVTGCDEKSTCGAPGLQARQDAQSAAAVSTVGFVAGGVLLAGGLALVLLAPSSRASTTARIAPMVGGRSGLLLEGRF